VVVVPELAVVGQLGHSHVANCMHTHNDERRGRRKSVHAFLTERYGLGWGVLTGLVVQNRLLMHPLRSHRQLRCDVQHLNQCAVPPRTTGRSAS